jgi:hypothetical protein
VSGTSGHEAALRLKYWVWFYKICYDNNTMNVDSNTTTESMRLDEAGGIKKTLMLVEPLQTI